MQPAKKQSRRVRKWQSDEEYVAAQAKDSSWSTFNHAWGDAAAVKFVNFGSYLGDRLCHDDKVADFGGNDGFASYNFYLVHKVKPLVVDCEPQRLDYADKQYRLSTYQSFLESMKELDNKSIDWGFCSHTLEHTRDTEKAMREIARVVKRGCCFILPLEDLRHARGNHAHAICFTRMTDWCKLLKKNGWNIVSSIQPMKTECHIYAEPV